VAVLLPSPSVKWPFAPFSDTPYPCAPHACHLVPEHTLAPVCPYLGSIARSHTSQCDAATPISSCWVAATSIIASHLATPRSQLHEPSWSQSLCSQCYPWLLEVIGSQRAPHISVQWMVGMCNGGQSYPHFALFRGMLVGLLRATGRPWRAPP
jgi:hypothetical protein